METVNAIGEVTNIYFAMTNCHSLLVTMR